MIFRTVSTLAAVALATGPAWCADITLTPGTVAVSETGTTAVLSLNLLNGVLPYSPVHPVTVVLQPSQGSPRGISLSATTVVFPAGATAAAVPITVSAIDDAVAEGPVTYAVVAQPFTLDVAVAATASSNVTVADNDAGVLVTPGPNIVVEEGDAASIGSFVLTHTTGTFSTTITSPSTGDADYPRDVEFATAPGGPWTASLTVSVSTVGLTVFVRASRSINLNGQDDPIAEGTEVIPVTVTPSVGGGSSEVIPVTVTDNDSAGIVILETTDSPYTVAEGALGLTGVEESIPGTADSYTIRLTSKPSTTVSIAVTADTQVSASPTSLVFTPDSWSQAQTVLVYPVDDAVVEANPHLGTITHVAESDDPRYDGIAGAVLSPSVRDNELAGTPGVIVAVDAGGVRVSEGGAGDTYRVRLASQPTADVVITVSPDTQVGTAPSTLTFTSTNWFVEQTVTVTAVDDAAIEGSHLGQISHGAASADGAYAGISISGVTAQVADNDGSSGTGLIITHTDGGMSVSESDGAAISPIVPPAPAWSYGTSDTFTVRLPQPPAGNIVVTVAETTSLAAPTAIEVLPTELIFTPATWNIPQLVTVRAINDDRVTAGRSANVRLTPSSTFTVENVPVSVLDDDAFTIDATATGILSEAAPAVAGSLDVVLASIPTGPTVVTIYTDGQTVVDTDPLTTGNQNTIAFTTTDWFIPQTIDVLPVDDALDESSPHIGTITLVANGGFGNASTSVTFQITDNDVTAPPGIPGVTVTPTVLSVSEDGASTTYSVQLNTEPTSTVRITVDPGAQALVNGIGGPIELIFAPGAWSTPQVVTVTAVDDAIDEAQPHSGVITHFMTSADAVYAGAGASVDLSITDNDTSDIVVAPTSSDTTVIEGGAGDSYVVYLASRPAGTVEVVINAPAPLLVQVPGMVSPAATASVFFSANGTGDGSSSNAPALWSQAIIVQVSASDDSLPNGTRQAQISHLGSSLSDTLYHGLTDQLAVMITDDEFGVVLVPSAVSVSEGSSITAAIVLSRQPSSSVTVTIPSTSDVAITGADVDLSTPDLDILFTTVNWDQPRGVIITAIDDSIVEGTLPESMIASAASADPGYNGSTTAVIVTVSDNGEVAGVVFSNVFGAVPTTLQVAEGGSGATYAVRITSDPGVPATVSVTPGSAQVAINGGAPGAPIVLTFTSTNWTTPQVITVVAVDDGVIEGSHSTLIAHASGGGFANAYDGLANLPVQVDISDNEQVVEIDWAASDVRTLTEGATQSSFLVRLTAPPATQAVVTFTPSSTQASCNPVSVTFTAANFSTARVVNLVATNDAIQDGPATVQFSIAADVPFLGVKEYALATVGSSTRSVTALDNDTAGVVITPSSLAIVEGGSAGSILISLSSQPIGDLVLTASDVTNQVRFLGPTDPVSASSATRALTFTSATWNIPQQIRVVAVEDALIEGSVSATVAFAQSGSATTVGPADDGYALAVVDVAVIAVSDNDLPSVSISANPVLVYEHQVGLGGWTITRTPGANLATGFAAGALDVPISVVTSGAWPAEFQVVSVGPAATSAVDLVTRTFTLTIPAGATSAQLSLLPVDDVRGGEADMAVTLRVRSAPGQFVLSLPSTASITIRDDEPVAATGAAVVVFPGLAVSGTLSGSATAIPTRAIVTYRLRPDLGAANPAVANLGSLAATGGFTVTAATAAVPGSTTSFAWEAVDSSGATSAAAYTVVRIASYSDAGRPRIVSDPVDEVVPVSGSLTYQVRAISGASGLRYLMAIGQIGAAQGASIDPVSGLLTWAVPAALAPGHYRIAILVVDDASSTADLQIITVRVVSATASN